MTKLILNDVTSGYASTTLVNANNTAIEIALENTLSRDGTGPNQMGAALDMNGNLILNQGNPVTMSGFNWEGPWVTGIAYQVGDVVGTNGTSYIAIVEHTASALFSTDNAKWQVVAESSLPTQVENAAKFLQTNGTVATWETPESSEVSFTQSGIDAVTTTVQNKLRESISVKDFGAVGDGTTDDTVAIQRAINYWSSGSGKVFFPQGVYKTTQTLIVAQDGVNLVGEGMRVSKINFVPTAGDTCIFFGKGGEGSVDGGIISECSVEKLWLYSSDTTYKKIGIDLKDQGECFISELKIGPGGNWTGAGSIGVKTRGRQLFSMAFASIYADLPINIAYNDSAPSLCADLFSFENILTSAANTYPNIQIDDKVVLSNVKFGGVVSLNGGNYGVYWNNTTGGIAESANLIFENVRYEQATDPTKYAFYLKPASLNLLSFSHTRFGGANAYPINGLYLRNTKQVYLSNCLNEVTGGREIINADSTVTSIQLNSNFQQTGGVSAITGMTLLSSFKNSVSSALPETGFFLSGALTTIGNQTTNASLIGSTISMANDAVQPLPTAIGLVVIVTSDNVSAVFMLQGSSGAVFELYDPTGFFTTTADNATTYNVYYSGGIYYLQNKRGSSKNIKFLTLGTSSGF